MISFSRKGASWPNHLLKVPPFPVVTRTALEAGMTHTNLSIPSVLPQVNLSHLNSPHGLNQLIVATTPNPPHWGIIWLRKGGEAGHHPSCSEFLSTRDPGHQTSCGFEIQEWDRYGKDRLPSLLANQDSQQVNSRSSERPHL